MTHTQLQSLQGHPERMNGETLYELRTLVARYPYYQEARLLLLTNLYLLHDTSFGSELRRAAFYVSDRKALYRLVHDIQPSLLPEDDAALTAAPQPDVDRTLSLIDAFLGTLPEEYSSPTASPLSLIPAPPATTDYMALLAAQEQAAAAPAQEQTAAAPATVTPASVPGTAAPAYVLETAAPASVLETAAPAATVPGGSPSGPSSASFWNTDWQALDTPMKATDNDTPAPSSAQAASDEEAALEPQFFTETLAAIYIKQKKYERALEIIRSLYLKYPEKNIYFADQIRFLEKLIRNNNYKKSK